MFKLLKEHFYNQLETSISKDTFLINSNPHIMKKLCERNPGYLKYVKGKSINIDIIETALKQVNNVTDFLLNQILYKGYPIEYNSLAMKYFCQLDGHYFTAARGKGANFENFLIASNHPDINKRLDVKYILEMKKIYLNDLDEKELKQFCQYDGRFLQSIRYKNITFDILKTAINHPDPQKRPDLLKFYSLRRDVDIMQKLIELDGQNFIYVLEEAANIELLNKALNHPTKKLSFDQIPPKFYTIFDYKLIEPLIEIDERWIKFVNLDTITDKGLIQKMQIDKEFVPTSAIIESFKHQPEVLKALYEDIEKGYYPIEKLNKIYSVYLDNTTINDEFFQKIINHVCQKNNVDYKFFKQYILKYVTLNDEILKTLNLEFLQERYHQLYDFNQYERLTTLIVYPDIQQSIIKIGKPEKNNIIDYKLGDKKIELLAKILNLLNTEEENKNTRNWTSYYMKVINSFEKYPELYNDIAKNIDKLDSELLTKITNYATGNHSFIVKNFQELIRYDEIKNNWINIKLESNEIEEVREAILEKNIGISLETAIELYSPYAEGILKAKELFSKDIVEFFKILSIIMEEENIDNLKYHMTKYQLKIKLKEHYTLGMRNDIKKVYIQAYNDTLYQIKDQKPNDTINNIRLYKAAGENGDLPFCISLSVLGAYSGFDPLKEDYNYKEEWLRPKISNHGICTSYISNNNIGLAHNEYSILGFTNYEDDALLLSGPTDIYSSNESFDVMEEEDKKSTYLSPQHMIDATRNNHNEMVMERVVANTKRMPSYIVLLCDNYEKTKRKYIFNKSIGRYSGRKDSLYGKEKNEGDMLHHALVTAKDFSLPIVIVEREKISLSEYKKIRHRINDFRNERKFNRTIIKKLFYDLIVNYENNYSGNKMYHRNINERFFSKNQSDEITDMIKDEISFQIKNNPITGLIMLEELEKISKNELEIKPDIECIYKYDSFLKFCQMSENQLFNKSKISENLYLIFNEDLEDNINIENYNKFYAPFIKTNQLSISSIKKGLTKSINNQITVTLNEIDNNFLFEQIPIKEVQNLENILLFSALIAKTESLSKSEMDLLLLTGLFYHVPEENKELLEQFLKMKYQEEDISIITNTLNYLNNKNIILTEPKTIKIAYILEDSINLNNINKENVSLEPVFHNRMSSHLIKLSVLLNENYEKRQEQIKEKNIKFKNIK